MSTTVLLQLVKIVEGLANLYRKLTTPQHQQQIQVQVQAQAQLQPARSFFTASTISDMLRVISAIVVLGATIFTLTTGQSVSFQTQALASKKSCDELSSNDCIMFEEAISKCASACQNKKDGSQTTTASSNGKKKKKKGCFHGDDQVQTTGGRMRISDIVGRRDLTVLTRDEFGKVAYSPIYYWIHANDSVVHEFLSLQTENGRNLSITKDHLIYETDCRGKSRTVFAGRVKPGSCVYILDSNGKQFVESRVVARHVTQKQGIYAPITYAGNIVVNDVLASCFVCYENEQAQKIMYSYMDKIHRLLTTLVPDFFVHLFYSTPFSVKVNVPEIVFSFWELAEKFAR